MEYTHSVAMVCHAMNVVKGTSFQNPNLGLQTKFNGHFLISMLTFDNIHVVDKLLVIFGGLHIKKFEMAHFCL